MIVEDADKFGLAQLYQSAVVSAAQSGHLLISLIGRKVVIEAAESCRRLSKSLPN